MMTGMLVWLVGILIMLTGCVVQLVSKEVIAGPSVALVLIGLPIAICGVALHIRFVCRRRRFMKAMADSPCGATTRFYGIPSDSDAPQAPPPARPHD